MKAINPLEIKIPGESYLTFLRIIRDKCPSDYGIKNNVINCEFVKGGKKLCADCWYESIKNYWKEYGYNG